MLEEERGVKFKAGVAERLLAYAKTVAHFPTALKEFEVSLSFSKPKHTDTLTHTHTRSLVRVLAFCINPKTKLLLAHV